MNFLVLMSTAAFALSVFAFINGLILLKKSRTARRFVYVVEHGCYEQAGVSGVYSSPEKAMLAFPAGQPTRIGEAASIERTGGWQKDVYESPTLRNLNTWSNGLDWHEAGTITEFELDAE